MIRLLSILWAVLVLCLPVALTQAGPVSQTMHKPKRTNITDSWKFGVKDGPTEIVTIQVLPGDDDIAKAKKLEKEIKDKIPNPAIKNRVIRDGAKITLPQEFTVFEYTIGDSGQEVQAGNKKAGKKKGKGSKMSIGYEGPASGIDIEGGPDPSFFEATFGYDGFSIASTISYADLVMPDAQGVLTAMYSSLYAQLPPILQPDLTLDLLSGSIFFEMDAGHTNYFVTNDTNDSTLRMRGGVESLVPEPSTFAMLGAGLVCAVARRRKRRRRSGSPY